MPYERKKRRRGKGEKYQLEKEEYYFTRKCTAQASPIPTENSREVVPNT